MKKLIKRTMIFAVVGLALLTIVAVPEQYRVFHSGGKYTA